ncbi:MAG: hypothetical protein ACFFAH_07810 [Promethearchaeota archaeon]
MQTLDESIISDIQKLIDVKEDKIAELEEESFSQILLILKETNSKYRPLFSEIKSKVANEEDANKEYNILLKVKKASINTKLKEIVNHRDKQIKELKKEIKVLNKEIKLLNLLK